MKKQQINYEQEVKRVYPDAKCEPYDVGVYGKAYSITTLTSTKNYFENRVYFGQPTRSQAWQYAYEQLVKLGEIKVKGRFSWKSFWDGFIDVLSIDLPLWLLLLYLFTISFMQYLFKH